MDLAQFADLTLTAALAVAVVALWRKVWELHAELMESREEARLQRNQILLQQEQLEAYMKAWRVSEN